MRSPCYEVEGDLQWLTADLLQFVQLPLRAIAMYSPKDLRAIQLLLSDCGQQIHTMVAQKFQVYEKGKHDYVTDVDRALDARLSEAIASLFPSDQIISEEAPQSFQRFQQPSSRIWAIDPLDGTEDFIQGTPYYSIMLGVLEATRPCAGWVYAPVGDRLCFGGPNWGLWQATARQEPQPLLPTPYASEHESTLLMGGQDQRRFGRAIAEHIPNVQFANIGSFGLKVLEIIQGRAAMYVYLNRRVKLWDTVGPLALADAAGLVCCDLAGNPIQFTSTGVDLATLTHHQPILIGWPHALETLRSPLQTAISSVLNHETTSKPNSSLP
ncbi:3'(2'),5'-bisphosphate nucleotidase CysQ family protein [Leptolyngbya sp. AN02str]|uniref:3'(2'),5'-bisphosphate nucleotidase CysQ family protein n=1 Tax=Leptolyngbya sp. AN02str TaxID=3423363 RepID=UPI003D31C6AA